MGTIWKDIAASVFMGMLLPGMLLNFASMLLDRQVLYSAPEETEPAQVTSVSNQSLMHLRLPSGQSEERGMEEYLIGVVLAEMPASFETEALKAQAVAARTYTRKAEETGGKHGDGSVCTRSVCCQAYIAPEDYLAQGGTQENLEKIREAVYATAGYVLTYEGELIEATYFSCSGGSTEDAAAVWGTDYPYLQAVDSPGEEQASVYTDTVSFSFRQFQNALGILLEGAPETWFGPVEYTEGGGVASLEIGGESYSGTQLRSLLGLRSTNFSLQTEPDAITVTTKGYGHRVGMSQYGADAMALQGSTYPQILEHYYQGTQLVYLK